MTCKRTWMFVDIDHQAFGTEPQLPTLECRTATVQAENDVTCLMLGRDQFTQLLGPLENIMKRDKSPEVHLSTLLA